MGENSNSGNSDAIVCQKDPYPSLVVGVLGRGERRGHRAAYGGRKLGAAGLVFFELVVAAEEQGECGGWCARRFGHWLGARFERAVEGTVADYVVVDLLDWKKGGIWDEGFGARVCSGYYLVANWISLDWKAFALSSCL